MKEPPTVNLSVSPDARSTTRLAFGRDTPVRPYYDSSAITLPLTPVLQGVRVRWWVRLVMWIRRVSNAR
jgi:hypothetical protein